jgi:hypothetical protein
MLHSKVAEQLYSDYPPDQAERLLALAKRSLRMTPRYAGGALPRGASKLGGLPDLPEPLAWPQVDGMPMGFVGQFNLAEITQYPAAAVLPTDGMLFFFSNSLPECRDSSNATWAVLHALARAADAAPVTPPDVDRRLRAPDFALSFFEEWTMPCFRSRRYRRAGFGELDPDTMPLPEEGEWGEDGPFFRMFGHADEIQREMEWEFRSFDPDEAKYKLQMMRILDKIGRGSDLLPIEPLREGAARGWGSEMISDPDVRDAVRAFAETHQANTTLPIAVREALSAISVLSRPKDDGFDPDDWVLLFQMDSLIDCEHDVDLCWDDRGRLYFWINRRDLARRRFDRVDLISQCG